MEVNNYDSKKQIGIVNKSPNMRMRICKYFSMCSIINYNHIISHNL